MKVYCFGEKENRLFFFSLEPVVTGRAILEK